MIYKVTNKKDEVITLSEAQLLDLLVNNVVNNKNPKVSHLSPAFAELLSDTGALTQATITQLLAMALEVGYRYKVFITTNDVEIEEQTDERNSDSASNSPSI